MPKRYNQRLKFLKVLRYHALYRVHARRITLAHKDFENKRVLILGPAHCVEQELQKLRSDQFDVIVKMNNGIWLPTQFADQTSDRCDVLFHSLTDDLQTLRYAQLDATGVRYLVHRTTGKGRFPLTLAAEKQFGTAERRVRMVPPDRYKQLSHDLGGSSPTTGLVCIDFFLQSNCAELTVVGFTFFQTRYRAGYDDRVQTDADSRERIKAAGHHDPEKERHLVRTLVDKARAAGKVVRLGAVVEAVLNKGYSE